MSYSQLRAARAARTHQTAATLVAEERAAREEKSARLRELRVAQKNEIPDQVSKPSGTLPLHN